MSLVGTSMYITIVIKVDTAVYRLVIFNSPQNGVQQEITSPMSHQNLIKSTS